MLKKAIGNINPIARVTESGRAFENFARAASQRGERPASSEADMAREAAGKAAKISPSFTSASDSDVRSEISNMRGKMPSADGDSMTFDRKPYPVGRDETYGSYPDMSAVKPPAGSMQDYSNARDMGSIKDALENYRSMSDMVSALPQPAREYSYKRGGYVSKNGKLNLGSGRSTTATKNKKSSNW
jgi:hypothetical protein